jgi:hypothetical protein
MQEVQSKWASMSRTFAIEFAAAAVQEAEYAFWTRRSPGWTRTHSRAVRSCLPRKG